MECLGFFGLFLFLDVNDVEEKEDDDVEAEEADDDEADDDDDDDDDDNEDDDEEEEDDDPSSSCCFSRLSLTRNASSNIARSISCSNDNITSLRSISSRHIFIGHGKNVGMYWTFPTTVLT